MARLTFGKQETIRVVEDVPLQGPNGEDLVLSYKTSTYFAGAGIYVSDDGYVLAVRGENGSYFPMPSGDRLQALQTAGSLPSPLPAYSLPVMDYVLGYSLWLILLGMGLYLALSGRNRTAPGARRS